MFSNLLLKLATGETSLARQLTSTIPARRLKLGLTSTIHCRCLSGCKHLIMTQKKCCPLKALSCVKKDIGFPIGSYNNITSIPIRGNHDDSHQNENHDSIPSKVMYAFLHFSKFDEPCIP